MRRLCAEQHIDFYSAVVLTLSAEPAESIFAFDQELSLARGKLDTTQFLAAAHTLRTRFVSDDGFEYFQNWFLSQGKGRFEQTIADPDSLAEPLTSDSHPLSCEIEFLSGAVDESYQKKTGGHRSSSNRITQTGFCDEQKIVRMGLHPYFCIRRN